MPIDAAGLLAKQYVKIGASKPAGAAGLRCKLPFHRSEMKHLRLLPI